MSRTPITDKIIADANACPETRIAFLIKHLANKCMEFEVCLGNYRAELLSIHRLAMNPQDTEPMDGDKYTVTLLKQILSLRRKP